MERRLLFVLLMAALAFAAGCSSGEGREMPARELGRPAVAVEVLAVASAQIRETIEVVGSLTPKFEVDIKSEYSGIVAEVFVTEWVKVDKGDRLARMDTREIELRVQQAAAGVDMARANLLQAQVAADRAERERQRLLQLKDVGLVTQQSLDEAGTACAAAAAAVAAAQAQLKASEETLRQAQTYAEKALIIAPMSGVVSQRGVSPGDLFQAMGGSGPMFRIVDNRILNLTVTVPSNELSRLAVGQPLEFSTDALPNKRFAGTVMFINPSVDPVSRSVKVVAEIENESAELRGGLFVEGEIITGLRDGVLQVPRSALLAWNVSQKTADVFVVLEGVAQRRPVQTGASHGEMVEIASGLQAADSVVTRGGFNLRDGDRVNVTAGQGA